MSAGSLCHFKADPKCSSKYEMESESPAPSETISPISERQNNSYLAKNGISFQIMIPFDTNQHVPTRLHVDKQCFKLEDSSVT